MAIIDPALLEEEAPPQEPPPQEAAPQEAAPQGASIDPALLEEEYISPGLGGVPDPAAVEAAYQEEAPPGPIQGALLETGDRLGAAVGGVLDAVSEPVTNLVESPVGQAVGAVLGTPLPGSEQIPVPPPTALGGAVTPEGAGGFGQQVAKRVGAAAENLAEGDVWGAVEQGLALTGDPYAHSMEAAGERVAAGKIAEPTLEEIIADPSQITALPAGGVASKPGDVGAKLIGQTIDEYAASQPPGTYGPGDGAQLYQDWLDSNPEVQSAPPAQLSNPVDVATSSNPLTRAAQTLGAIPEMLGGYQQSATQGTLTPFVKSMIVQGLGDPMALVPEEVGMAATRAAGRAVGRIPGVNRLTSLAPTTEAKIASEASTAAGQELLTATERGATPPGAVVPEITGDTLSPVPPPTNGLTPNGNGTGGTVSPLQETYPQWPLMESPPARTVTREAPEPTVAPMTGARQGAPAAAPLESALRTRLTEAGFGDYELRVADRLEDLVAPEDLVKLQAGKASPGGYHSATRKLIQVALDSDLARDYIDAGISPTDARRMASTALLDHEIVHATRQAGLFTEVEWDHLIRAADEQGLVKKIADDPVYEDLVGPARSEEAVATLYQNWREGRLLSADPVTQGLLERFFTFLSGLGKALKDTVPESILRNLESGEIGKRPRAPVSTGGTRTALTQMPSTRNIPQQMPQGVSDALVRRSGGVDPFKGDAQKYRDWFAENQLPSIESSGRVGGFSDVDPTTNQGLLGTNAADQIAVQKWVLNELGYDVGDYTVNPRTHTFDAPVTRRAEGPSRTPVATDTADFAAIRTSPSFQTTIDDVVPEPVNPPTESRPVLGADGLPVNARYHLENRSQFVGPGPGAGRINDFQIGQAWDRALATVDPRVRTELAGVTPPNAATFESALRQDWDNILFYEDGVAAMRDAVDLPTGHMNVFTNLFGATSQNTLPYTNTLRTLGAMAEHMQGIPIRTPATNPYPMAKAVRLTHLDSPKMYNYAGEFKHGLGMMETQPTAVVDIHMARALGMGKQYRNLSTEGYKALASFFENVRDDINAGRPGEVPLQTRHVQQAIWEQQRGPKPGGNPIAGAFTKARATMEALGILQPGEKISTSTFMDPRMIDQFGQTAEFAARMPYANLEEMRARGVVSRAYQTMETLPPPQQAAFRKQVVQPFRDGLRKDVYPLLMKTFAGSDLVKSRGQDFVRVTGALGDAGEDVFALPLGASVRGDPRFAIQNIELAEAMLRESLGIENVEIVALRDPLGLTPEERMRPGLSQTAEVHFFNTPDVTPEKIAQFSMESGYPISATRYKSGGTSLVFDTMPGQVLDRARMEAALHRIWPGREDVAIHEKIRDIGERTGDDYESLKARFISGQNTTVHDRTALVSSQKLAAGRINGLKQFESAATKLRATWESNARRFLGEPDDIATDLAADPAVLRTDGDYAILRRGAQARRNAAVGNDGAPESYQRDFADRALAEPRLYGAGWVTEDAARILDAPTDGRIRFRDGETPRGKSVGEVAQALHADFSEWLNGYDRLGQPESWTHSSKKWQQLEKRFNPNGDVDTTTMRPVAGNPEADTTAARAREQFLSDVWADANRFEPDPVKRTKLGEAWEAYSGAVRPMILFNWLNIPRYILQNLTGNSINVTARGGGIGVAAGLFTDFRQMGSVFRNLKSQGQYKTPFNAKEAKMGVGTSPNVQMNQAKYFEQMRQPSGNRALRAAEQLVAPDFLRWAAGTPDQAVREQVGSKAIDRGFTQLNREMPKKVYDEVHSRLGRTAYDIPQGKINQVLRDFFKEQSTLTDPNTGELYRGVTGKPGKFTPIYAAEDLRDYLFKRLDEDMPIKPDKKLYFDAVDRIYRDTKPKIKTIRTNAADQVDHALHNWRNTVGDEMLAKATLFHWWGSRQGGFYVNEGIKHPILLSSYGRMMTEMEEQSEELGAPAWLHGFFQFANSPAGMSTWHSPFDFFGSMLTMADWQFAGDPDAFRDMTALGQKMRQLPFFIHPGLQFVAYELGLLGPDYPAPNVTGAEGFISKVGDLMNLANANDAPFMAPFNAMGVGVDAQGNKVPIPTRPLNELYGRVGNAISTALQPLTGLNPVEVISGTATFDRNLKTYGATKVRGQHPEWSETEVLNHVDDVMMDPGSAEYQDWYRTTALQPYTAGNLPQPLGGLARIASPIGMTAMPEQRALDTMGGLNPSGNITTPTIDPNDPMADKIQNRSKYGMSSTPEGSKLTQWDIEFKSLVDPVVMEARYQAGDITGCSEKYGCDLTEPIMIGGREYAPEEIITMNYATKQDLKAQYLADRNLTEEDLSDSFQREQAYKDAHPDYAAYDAYKGLVGHTPVPEGSDITPQQAFTEQTMLTNPGFAQHVRNEMTDYETGVIDYDRAFNPDSYLAVQGVRPSVYSPVVGNEPTTTPGGYPSIAGVEEGRPLLDSVTPTVDAPLLPGPYDDVTDETTIVAPGHPLQVLDPYPRNGKILVGSLDGEYVGFLDQSMYEITSPAAPAGGVSPNGAVPTAAPSTTGQGPSNGGGLAGLAGGAISALGGAVQGIGDALGGLTGHNSGAPVKPDTGVTTGYTDLVPANDGIGVQSTDASDRTWMEDMMGGHAAVTTDYKGPTPNADYSYQIGHGADATTHAAYDISCDTGDCIGTPIAAPLSGKVVCAGYGEGTGEAIGSPQCTYSQGTTLPGQAHTIVLDVGTDAQGNTMQLSFNHMGTSEVTPGQTVSAGTLLGGMGNTDAGPHVHLEGWIYSPELGTYKIVDPQLIVSGWYKTHGVDEAMPIA